MRESINAWDFWLDDSSLENHLIDKPFKQLLG